MGRAFLLAVSFFAYGWSLLLTVYSVWSFLLTIEIGFGLFCLRWKIGLVFSAYGFPPRAEIGLGLLCLRFPHRK